MTATVAAPQLPSAGRDRHSRITSVRSIASRVAAGPETLDWDAQPNPSASSRVAREHRAAALRRRCHDQLLRSIHAGRVTPATAHARLARRRCSNCRWACLPGRNTAPIAGRCAAILRAAILHPTEAYVACSRACRARRRALSLSQPRPRAGTALRAARERTASPAQGFAIGLSSIHWREAWKYGERAFRYCQLDIGHALGAVRYAAGALGWSARMVEGVGSDRLAKLMGLDRDPDFARAEREDADPLAHHRDGPRARPPATTAFPTPVGPRSQWAGLKPTCSIRTRSIAGPSSMR